MIDTDTPRAWLASGLLDRVAMAARERLAHDPEDQEALSVLGQALLSLGQPAQGVAMLATLARPDPDDEVALIAGLRRLNLMQEVESRSAIRSTPVPSPATTTSPEPGLWLDRGNRHLAEGALDQAAADYRKALEGNPDFAPAHGNLANVLTMTGQLEDAHRHYRAALAADPNNANIGFAYALSLLLAGQAPEGWRWYEARRRTPAMRWNYDRHADLPQWQPGTDLTGRSVLVMAEQGRGDMIQHARYVPLLAARAAGVVLELPADLHPLFAGMPGIRRLIDRDGPADDCDLACPLMSLPLALDAVDTPPPPSVDVPVDARAIWAAWLGDPDGRRRIGLVVSGDARHPHDALRSIPLEAFRSILAYPAQWVLLQTELRDDDLATRDTLEGLRVPGAALVDFGDTAGLAANLNLVITVDTAVAHLAGSLGVPTWLLLAHAPDYRWMLNRSDTPWYPSMRLFRQPRPGDWPAVLDTVRRALDGSEGSDLTLDDGGARR